MTDRAVKLVLVFTVLLGMLILMVSRAEATTLYVATDGSDSTGTGTKDLPYATIGKARDILTGTTGNTVYIRGGTYRITSAITFDSGDSGAAGAPNVYRNYPGEIPIISGGKVLTSVWTETGGGIWSCAVGADEFRSLWVDGVRAQRAKEPDEDPETDYDDYYITQASSDSIWKMAFTEGDIDSGWTHLDQVEIQYIGAFTSMRQRIASVDDVNDEVTFNKAASDNNTKWYTGQPYWVENVFEGLDTPREWYLNTDTNTLSYYPIGGKNPNTSEIIVGSLGYSGSVATGAFVHCNGADYLEFRGITFSHSDWYMSNNGFPGYEILLEYADGAPGYLGTPSAIYATNTCEGLRFTDCTFSSLGGHGLQLYGSNHAISYCKFSDIGGSAIHIGSLASTTENNITITDNTIDGVSVVFPVGKGITVHLTSYTTVMHNTVRNGKYMGIQLGAQTTAQSHNTVAYNDVSDVGDPLIDSGAIYICGAQSGGQFSHNKVHDMEAAQSAIYTALLLSGKGLYLDAGTSGVVLENNWVYRVPWGYLQGSANNILRNNVFADIGQVGTMITFNASGETYANIFQTAQEHLFSWYKSPAASGSLDYNLLYNENAGYTNTAYGWSWAAEFTNIQSQGYETHAVTSDPLFVDAENDDYSLQPGSPALLPRGSGGIGFEQITGMGTVGPRSKILRVH